MNKEKCDHIIGFKYDYDDSTLITVSSKEGNLDWGYVKLEWFDYCPMCGEKLNKEGKDE